MFRSSVIGNLGADARVESSNGRSFISFNVAHNDRFVREDGSVVESMQWVSCAMNGDSNSKLLPFLTKGRLVYVEGRTATRVFSSEKERRMVAGVNLSVDHLELVGAPNTDIVPRRLFDKGGVMHDVHKSYWISDSEAAGILGGAQTAILMAQDGQKFQLSSPCWVSPMQGNDSDAQSTQVVTNATGNDNATTENTGSDDK